VSGVNEPGEGEHKILRWLREGKLHEKGDVLVYGLDADLILLSMLVGTELNIPLWLIREKQEFAGGLAQPPPGEVQEYTCMNLKEFQERLGIKGLDQTINYIALMSLMGNDFLPHSLSHKLGDDGHEYVVDALKSGVQLVNSKGELNVKALQSVCAKWAKNEEEKVGKMIAKKQEQAGRGVLKGMKEIEGLPLTWNVEQALLDPTGSLSSQWRSLYWQFIHPQGQTQEYVQQLCREYVIGCQWVLDYYMGKPVDQGWMFPSWVPPLWSDVAKTDVKGWDTKERKQQHPIQPQEQLAMVLPLESWNLIRDHQLKTLPEKLPQYWPEKFGFFSLGRKWLWECEALIPPLRVERVRGILKHQ
jgi:5'-3' exonuclease